MLILLDKSMNQQRLRAAAGWKMKEIVLQPNRLYRSLV
jgi:hypothetical protein